MRTREELLNAIQRSTATDPRATKEDHEALSALTEILLDIRDQQEKLIVVLTALVHRV